MHQNFKNYLFCDLLANPNYPSDWARARAWAKVTQQSESMSQSQIHRARRSGLSPRPTSGAPHQPVAPRTKSYYVYCIQCIHPNHFYIGQSSNIVERLKDHQRGKTSFILEHGIERYFLITQTHDLETALRIEYLLYGILKNKGVIVGGMSRKEELGLMYEYALKRGY